MPRILRWGFLSTARINRALFSPLHNSPRNELGAVASRTIQKASEYAQKHEIARAHGSYEELINDPEIDVIYNSLPNHLHADWTVQAALAGKHVLVEKPIALTVSEVEQIDDAARDTGVVVAEAFMYRHHPQTLQILEMVSSGELGEITLLRGRFNFVLSRPDDFRWKPEFGGGGMWDVGCYLVSYARAITGLPPEKVSAWQTRTATGVDETVIGHLHYPNGVMAQIATSINLPHHTSFEIIGTKASLYIPEPFAPRHRLSAVLKVGDDEKKINLPGQELYIGEVEDMADAILEGKPTRISLEESRQNIATLVALLQSADRAGTVIELDNYL